MALEQPNTAPQSIDQKAGIGLALSAGGAKGAYQLGCWRAFVQHGISFAAVAGSSIGALNGALVCQGDWEAACRLWFEFTHLSVGSLDYHKVGRLLAGVAGDLGLLLIPVPNVGWVRAIKYATSVVKFASNYGALGALRRNGLFNMSEIKLVLKRHVDMAKIQAQPIPLYVTACGEPRATRPLGPAHWFKIQERNEEEAWNLITASMSVPFVFSPVQVRGQYYTDGGLGYWLPIEPLCAHGIRNMIAVSTKADTTYNPRRYPGSNIILIKPRKTLGRFPLATFRFTETAVKRWMDEGYEDALRVLDRQGKIGQDLPQMTQMHAD